MRRRKCTVFQDSHGRWITVFPYAMQDNGSYPFTLKVSGTWDGAIRWVEWYWRYAL